MIKTETAIARVRNDVCEYFVQLSGHGLIDAWRIANGEMDAEDHADEIWEKSGEAISAANPDVDDHALLHAIAHVCHEIVADCIADAVELEAAESLAQAVRDVSDEDAEEFSDYVGAGFPIGIDVRFDAEGRVTEIRTELGHNDGFEWHGTGKSLSELRAMNDETLTAFFDGHVDVAISNHRDQLEAA